MLWSFRLCLLIPPSPHPRGCVWFSASTGLRLVTRVSPLSASKCHMSSNSAENRKPRQLEDSPVIQQGMTIQLLLSLSSRGVMVQDSFLPCRPFPGWPGGAEPACTLSYHLWRPHGQTLLGPSFYLSSLAFFGVGRLRNVECCNVGRGVEKWDPLSCPVLPFHPGAQGGSWLPLAPQVPLPSWSQCHVVSLQLCGPGPVALTTRKPRLQLWLPVV